MSEKAMTETTAETQEREAAATARLLDLMTQRGMEKWVALFGEGVGGEDTRERFLTALVSAAVHCTGPSLRRAGITWEEMQPALLGETATETTRRAMKRIGRAARLIKRLVLGGDAPG